ncbi:MAG: lysostaphin resistance A-like protein [Limisphaerales bacterium]
MALVLIPKDLIKADPTGPAWTFGPSDGVIKGFVIGSFFALIPLLLDALYPSHPIRNQRTIESGEPVIHMLATPGVQQVLACIVVALLAPISEEMMFRGVFYGGLRKSFGPVWAAMVTTGIFVAIHYPEFIYAPDWIFIFIAGAFGLLWCRLHWNAIGPAIAAHGGYNLVVAVVPSIHSTFQHYGRF